MIRRTYKQDGTVVETVIDASAPGATSPRELRVLRRLLTALVQESVITQNKATAVFNRLKG